MGMENKLDLSDVANSHHDILAIIEPYISEYHDMDSSNGAAYLRQRRNNLMHSVANLIVKQLKSGGREKTVADVKQHYERAYSASHYSGYAIGKRTDTFLFGDKLLKMNVMGLYRAMSGIVETMIRKLDPDSVCEIGCGKGTHLMCLSSIFHDTRFMGVDLSSDAIALAKRRQQEDSIDLQIPDRPGPLSPEAIAAVRKVDFLQGSADDVEAINDKSVDLTYTIAALEQMWVILPDVLKEIRRITKKYVIFVEPFWEHNSFLGKTYLVAGNYFRAKTSFIEDHGFRAIQNFDCLPLKASFKYSVLVAEVVD